MSACAKALIKDHRTSRCTRRVSDSQQAPHSLLNTERSQPCRRAQAFGRGGNAAASDCCGAGHSRCIVQAETPAHGRREAAAATKRGGLSNGGRAFGDGCCHPCKRAQRAGRASRRLQASRGRGVARGIVGSFLLLLVVAVAEKGRRHGTTLAGCLGGVGALHTAVASGVLHRRWRLRLKWTRNCLSNVFQGTSVQQLSARLSRRYCAVTMQPARGCMRPEGLQRRVPAQKHHMNYADAARRASNVAEAGCQGVPEHAPRRGHPPQPEQPHLE